MIFQKKLYFCASFILVFRIIVIFEKARKRIATMLLRKRSARVKRRKMLYDFASAKYVGVVCAPQDEVNTRHLRDFLYHLTQKGIQYSVFAYFDGNEIPENYLYWKGLDFITRKDLDFFLIPKSQIVERFINEPFDILINCTVTQYFPVEYISHLSVAKCKVGIMREGEASYDLMIDIKKSPTIEYFLKNLEKYLANIRHPQFN